MTAWLSSEWFDEVQALGTDCPARPDLSGTIQFELTGDPTGPVRCYAVLEDGRLQSGSTGKAAGADVGLTASFDDGEFLNAWYRHYRLGIPEVKLSVPEVNTREYERYHRGVDLAFVARTPVTSRG